jgi:hypothetical protein
VELATEKKKVSISLSLFLSLSFSPPPLSRGCAKRNRTGKNALALPFLFSPHFPWLHSLYDPSLTSLGLETAVLLTKINNFASE